MKEFIEHIIKQLVDSPAKVTVTKVNGEHISIFELHVGDGDMGKVIGKKGRTNTLFIFQQNVRSIWQMMKI